MTLPPRCNYGLGGGGGGGGGGQQWRAWTCVEPKQCQLVPVIRVHRTMILAAGTGLVLVVSSTRQRSFN